MEGGLQPAWSFSSTFSTDRRSPPDNGPTIDRMNELEYTRSPNRLTEIVERTNALGFDMASDPRTGSLLRTLAACKPNGRFLELGTGTGIATAWLLDGMDASSNLTSVDTDARVQDVARTFLGDEKRLILILEDGLEFLKQQPAESFDFVFADAMPGKYEGLPECLRVVKPGGFYVIDDMLPQPNWPEGHAQKVPVLLEALAANKGFSIARLAWATGVVVAVKLVSPK